MQNEVNQETEGSATGETPVVDTNIQEQPAAAQAPVAQDTAATSDEASAAERPAETPAAAAEGPQQPSAPAQAAAPRRVAKPAAPKAEEAHEEKGGDIDFGAILEQFEQEQTVYHAGD